MVVILKNVVKKLQKGLGENCGAEVQFLSYYEHDNLGMVRLQTGRRSVPHRRSTFRYLTNFTNTHDFVLSESKYDEIFIVKSLLYRNLV